MRKKTEISFLLVVVMLLGGVLCSCSSDEPEDPKDRVTEVKLDRFCDGIYSQLYHGGYLKMKNLPLSSAIISKA